MFINHIVMAGSNNDGAIEEPGSLWQVFTDLYSLDGGVDRVVGGTCLSLLWIAEPFGIESIDVAGSTSQPDEDTAVSLAFWGPGSW
jgi:hypothetical protein